VTDHVLIRSEDHVHSWCSHWGQPRGSLLTLEQTWDLASAWYSEDRRDPTWRRKTLDEIEPLFARLGLTSEFWSLR
jgi:hypothetical protein